MRDQFIERLSEMAESDPRVMLVTGDLGFGVLNDYRRRFPSQFINAGVAEQNMTGMATGLAMEGFIVYTYSIANFTFMRCLEQIRNDAAYHEANVNVVSIGGGFSYGALGMSHHATEDLAIMRALPGLTVVSPCDNWETMEAAQALAATPGPSYLRLDKSTAGETNYPGEVFELGKARRLREGTDLTIAACGGIVDEVLQAADQLREQGIRCRVLSVHTIKPLDTAALVSAAQETGGLLTVEEHNIVGGLGSAIAETLLDSGVFVNRFRRIGLADRYSSIVGSQGYLRSKYEMDRHAIIAAVKDLLNGAAIKKAA
ncbi:transketolase family protein [Lignipirellula cremea]|uniref:1-deoxy-D-xylulose-5-phosphate synthase n=1 Tax=Lignipirellula cremea TaxID=2528010 RepID=A0A518E4M3_9BACT|nr:transketolase C-terminal domain-containing protein [Lignipirellula cremea]QDU99040.1 1-deoxy-D-xylulose-5-phosphate synthase [Lignipirellula cremea]